MLLCLGPGSNLRVSVCSASMASIPHKAGRVGGRQTSYASVGHKHVEKKAYQTEDVNYNSINHIQRNRVNIESTRARRSKPNPQSETSGLAYVSACTYRYFFLKTSLSKTQRRLGVVSWGSSVLGFLARCCSLPKACFRVSTLTLAQGFRFWGLGWL